MNKKTILIITGLIILFNIIILEGMFLYLMSVSEKTYVKKLKTGSFVNLNHFWELTKIKAETIQNIELSINQKGTITALDKDVKSTYGNGTPVILKYQLVFSNNSERANFGFFDNSLKVTKVYDKDNKPISLDSLKIGDVITLRSRLSILGDCKDDKCFKEIVINVLKRS